MGSATGVSESRFDSSFGSLSVDVVGSVAGVTIACVMHGALLFGVHKNFRRRPRVSCKYGAVP